MIGLFVDSEYVMIIDDDEEMGSRWVENCLETSRTTGAIVTSAGVAVGRDGEVLQSPALEKIREIDYGGRTWFLRTEWLRLLFSCYVPSWEQAEDMMISACLWIKGRIRTVLPRMPANDRSFWASDTLHINDTQTTASHSRLNTGTIRVALLRYWIQEGWQPILLRMAYDTVNITQTSSIFNNDNNKMKNISSRVIDILDNTFWKAVFQIDLNAHHKAMSDSIYDTSATTKATIINEKDNILTRYSYLRALPTNFASYIPYRSYTVKMALSVSDLLIAFDQGQITSLNGEITFADKYKWDLIVYARGDSSDSGKKHDKMKLILTYRNLEESYITLLVSIADVTNMPDSLSLLPPQIIRHFPNLFVYYGFEIEIEVDHVLLLDEKYNRNGICHFIFNSEQ